VKVADAIRQANESLLGLYGAPRHRKLRLNRQRRERRRWQREVFPDLNRYLDAFAVGWGFWTARNGRITATSFTARDAAEGEVPQAPEPSSTD
jgi:hypothetical protein